MTSSDDDTTGVFDPTPLEPARPGAWVESEAELFDRERRAMEDEIEAARSRAAGARERLAAQREGLVADLAADEAAAGRALAELEAQHVETLRSIEIDSARQVDDLLAAARREADEIVRSADPERGGQ